MGNRRARDSDDDDVLYPVPSSGCGNTGGWQSNRVWAIFEGVWAVFCPVADAPSQEEIHDGVAEDTRYG